MYIKYCFLKILGVYCLQKVNRRKNEMNDFLKSLENILIDLWNYLYVFLCHLTNTEPDIKNEWVEKE